MAPSLPTFVVRPFTRCADIARGTLGSLTWEPALAVAKPAIDSVFSKIEIGTLLLVDKPAGTRQYYGQKLSSKTTELNGAAERRADSIPRVEIVVNSDAFWMRLFLFADMGFAESYMLGEFECADLTAFFKLFILNRDQMSNGTTLFSALSGAITSIARNTNTLSNALLNIQAHYDISNDMFAAFLSDDMTYSCPIWKPRGVAPNETLEEAQATKLQRFIDGTRIKGSDHVLEIGTGWGSFAIAAVRQTGCRVTSLTLSKEQKQLAEERIREAGFADKIQVKLMDYRNLPIPDKPYDKIVSIEMLEAVGKEFLATYFSHIDRLLKKDGGIAAFQCITMPEGRYEAYSKSEDFINKHIFPGGHLPNITQLLNHISTESKGTLIVEKVENIGGHYAKALRLWKEKFLENFESQIRPALKLEHPDMSQDEIDVFRRKWEYYFTYCEAGFVTKTLGDVIITVGREGALELMEDVPLRVACIHILLLHLQLQVPSVRRPSLFPTLPSPPLTQTTNPPHLNITTTNNNMSAPAFPPGGTLLDTFKESFVNVPVDAEKDNAVATTQFLDAAESLTTIFDALGSVAFSPVKNDLLGNIKKLRERQAAAPAESETVQALCLNELKTKKHVATEGLVWLVRGLDFTCIALSSNVNSEKEELSDSFRNAYGSTLKPHHSFLVKPVFSAAMSACPYRKVFYEKLGSDPEKVQAELRPYLKSLEHIVAILKGFLDRKEAKW